MFFYKYFLNRLEKSVNSRYLLIDPTQSLELPKILHQIPRDILNQKEASLLMDIPPKTPLGIRGKAILEVMYASGIRNTELCSLNMNNLNLMDKTLHLEKTKNNRERMVPIGGKAKEALENYLNHARPVLSYYFHEKAIFLNRYGKRVRRHDINCMLRRYAKKMALEKSISAHTLRHSFATHMLENGAGLREIQLILGHRCISTTQIYTRIANTELKQTMNRCHPREKNKRLKGGKDHV